MCFFVPVLFRKVSFLAGWGYFTLLVEVSYIIGGGTFISPYLFFVKLFERIAKSYPKLYFLYLPKTFLDHAHDQLPSLFSKPCHQQLLSGKLWDLSWMTLWSIDPAYYIWRKSITTYSPTCIQKEILEPPKHLKENNTWLVVAFTNRSALRVYLLGHVY